LEVRELHASLYNTALIMPVYQMISDGNKENTGNKGIKGSGDGEG
jgi:hypothetical protein